MLRNFALWGILLVSLIACSRSDDSFYALDVAPIGGPEVPLDSINFEGQVGLVNIHTTANANFSGYTDPRYILDISGANNSYCHPDVEYFANGLMGYKYWMVFTPYFGSVGTNQDSKKYENPTVVVSNDGIDWVSPTGARSPLMGTPAVSESFPENNVDPKQGFWSDVDWLFYGNQFYLYYRGSYVTAGCFKNRGAKSTNNTRKSGTNAARTIVQQKSGDGVNWTPFEIAYTSNIPYCPKDDHLLSPTFVHNGKEFVSYEVELNTGKKNFKGNEFSYVIQRKSSNGIDFSIFTRSKIVNFVNKPWKKLDQNYSPWHIQACYIEGYYFMCLAVGNVKKYTSEALYLAYSTDGVNYVVLQKPLLDHNAYRSSVFPMGSTTDTIHFGAMIANKNGEFRYREFMLKKSDLR